METQQIGKGISYDHLSADDKHYFGGFLNLAQNNIDSVMQEFCSRLSLNYDKNKHKDIINNYFKIHHNPKEKPSHTDWERGVAILKEYWPVVNAIDLPLTAESIKNLPLHEQEKTKREYFTKTLIALFSAIETLRHYYTHFYHPPVTLPESLFAFLDKTLFHTIIDVKKTKMKEDKTRQILKDSLQDQIKKLTELKKKELIEKKKENPRINTNDSEGILNSIYNDAFSHFLYTDKVSKKEVLSKWYASRLPEQKLADSPIEISASGLVFLLSMFLSRKEVEHLKSNITGYKGKVLAISEVTKKENGLKFMATHWVFSILTFKGIKHRITSSFEKETFLMQIVDELNKVPDEIYQTLSDGNKKIFLEDMNEYVSESEGEDEVPLYVVHPVIRKRYEDKFSYFAIRFLDEYANFPSLRFQVFAGQYKHDNRPKEIAGTNTVSERIIKQRINVFGRLSEIVKKKNDYFELNPEPKGWELFPNPSYNWVDNNISAHIDLINKGGKAKEIQILSNQLHKKLNPKQKTGKRIPREEIVKLVFDGKAKQGNPTLLLSNNELMSMLYEFLVNKKSGEELENQIVDKIIERYNLLTEFDPQADKVHKSLLPKKLLKSQSGADRTDHDKLLRAIEKEIDRGEEKRSLIEQYEKELQKGLTQNKFSKEKKRKYLFYSSEMGTEATWIANDLKRFMPVAARLNWKGYHHSELQQLIAYYPSQHTQARDLLASVWNLNDSSPYWSSAFGSLFSKPKFEDFYKSYLSQRKAILEGFIGSIQNTREVPKLLKKVLNEVYIVFDKRLYQINKTETQKDELLAKPFVFPRGLFEEKPTSVPGCKPQTDPEQFADWYVFGYNYPGKFQAFYNMERNYIDLYREKGIKKELNRFKIDCDQRIKKTKFQDVYLKLIADKLFEGTFGQPLAFDLGQLYDTREQQGANTQKALRQKDKAVGDMSGNVLNENYLWNKPTTVTLANGQIVDHGVKLKDVGKFRRFITEPKVETLLSYDQQRVWTKLEIENELENKENSYEHVRRHKLLRQIHQLENHLLKQVGFDGIHHPAQFNSANGNPNFKMYVVNGLLVPRTDVSQEDYQILLNTGFEHIDVQNIKHAKPIVKKAFVLIYLRNKFGHNQLPQREHYLLMRELFSSLHQDSYSGFFNRIISKIIEEFISN